MAPAQSRENRIALRRISFQLIGTAGGCAAAGGLAGLPPPVRHRWLLRSFWPVPGLIDPVAARHHDADMRTTINISDGILHELREVSRRRGRPFREVLEETLQRGLGTPPPGRRRAPLRTYRVGIKPAYLGTSMNQLYDQLEADEALKGGRP
ncbi:MAG: hypothetical protein ACKV19_22955 [Verrucomicrobiales bacterium]